MKRILLSLVAAVTLSFTVFGQAPQSFNYQSVVRDAGGTILNNQAIGMQMSILQGGPSGTVVYQETFTPTSNGYGLVNLQIGTGTVVSGDFSLIDWSTGLYFMETAMDVSGGTNFVVMGTSQLMSVPYALYAVNSGSSIPGPQGPAGNDGADGLDGAIGPQGPAGSANISGTINHLVKFTAPNIGGNSQVFDNGTNIGINTINPTEKLHVVGNSLTEGNVFVTNDNAIETGFGVPGKDVNAGKIMYQKFSTGLDIIGAGTTGTNRQVTVWAEDGTDFKGNTTAFQYQTHLGSGDILEVGDDAWIKDINTVNTISVRGTANPAQGGIALGDDLGANPNQYLYGANNNIGIGTTNPQYRLEIDGNTFTRGLHFPNSNGIDPAYVGTNGNYLAFGHFGVSEDFIGYKNNAFWFKDTPGGGDGSDPVVRTDGRFENKNIAGVGFFGGDLNAFGQSVFESNTSGGITHLFSAENGNKVFQVGSGGQGYFESFVEADEFQSWKENGVNFYGGDAGPVGQAVFESNTNASITHIYIVRKLEIEFSKSDQGVHHSLEIT